MSASMASIRRATSCAAICAACFITAHRRRPKFVPAVRSSGPIRRSLTDAEFADHRDAAHNAARDADDDRAHLFPHRSSQRLLSRCARRGDVLAKAWLGGLCTPGGAFRAAEKRRSGADFDPVAGWGGVAA